MVSNDIGVKLSIAFLQSGRTPLQEALIAGRANEHVVETLIKAGADVNFVDSVSYYLIS